LNDYFVGFFRAWCIPGVPFYAFSYLCLKLVNYCLFFWLPLYLSNTIFDHSADADTKADSLSQLYDVGQVRMTCKCIDCIDGYII
jgi:hypothetical protein